ncbi:hypothetical protein FHG87_024682 [Trinorchestia longiramus]|nr:hypothetical protein FHG87_024682 [Trinorchestia longiramus]
MATSTRSNSVATRVGDDALALQQFKQKFLEGQRLKDLRLHQENRHPQQEDRHPQQEDRHPYQQDLHLHQENRHPQQEDVHNQQVLRKTGSGRSITSSEFYGDDQRLIKPYDEDPLLTKGKFPLAYSSSGSTERLGLDSPDSLLSRAAPLGTGGAPLGTGGAPLGTGGAEGTTKRTTHQFGSSKSLLSLFGNTSLISGGSRGGLVELSGRALHVSTSGPGKYPPMGGSNEPFRSSTTILDSVHRPPLMGGTLPSGRSGRITLDSVIRAPLVDHPPTAHSLSTPLAQQVFLTGTMQENMVSAGTENTFKNRLVKYWITKPSVLQRTDAMSLTPRACARLWCLCVSQVRVRD